MIFIYNFDLITLNENEPEEIQFRKNKLNRYEKKQYHEKLKHLQKINHFAPWYIYGFDENLDNVIYWKRYYVQNKFSRKLSNRKIRHQLIGKETFNFKGNSFKKVYDYWNDIF